MEIQCLFYMFCTSQCVVAAFQCSVATCGWGPPYRTAGSILTSSDSSPTISSCAHLSQTFASITPSSLFLPRSAVDFMFTYVVSTQPTWPTSSIWCSRSLPSSIWLLEFLCPAVFLLAYCLLPLSLLCWFLIFPPNFKCGRASGSVLRPLLYSFCDLTLFGDLTHFPDFKNHLNDDSCQTKRAVQTSLMTPDL